MPCELPKELRRTIGRYIGCSRSSGSSLPENYEISECYRKLNREFSDAGTASYVGSGVHRSAYSFRDAEKNNCVVKVATGAYGGVDGKEANLSEAGMWRALPRAQRKYFWPVNHSDSRGWWVTGPKVDVGVDEDEDVVMLEEKTGCTDLHSGNVGMYEGRPVVLDSGFEGSGCPSGLPPPRSPSFRQWKVQLPKYAMRRARRIF